MRLTTGYHGNIKTASVIDCNQRFHLFQGLSSSIYFICFRLNTLGFFLLFFWKTVRGVILRRDNFSFEGFFFGGGLIKMSKIILYIFFFNIKIWFFFIFYIRVYLYFFIWKVWLKNVTDVEHTCNSIVICSQANSSFSLMFLQELCPWLLYGISSALGINKCLSSFCLRLQKKN